MPRQPFARYLGSKCETVSLPIRECHDCNAKIVRHININHRTGMTYWGRDAKRPEEIPPVIRCDRCVAAKWAFEQRLLRGGSIEH